MPKLSSVYSESLVKLIRSGDAPIDAIEVGPWFSHGEIKRIQEELPEWQFHFHASGVITRLGYRPKSLRRLREYLLCTKSSWISVHLELLPFSVYWLSSRYGLHLNPPDCERMKTKFIHLLGRIKDVDPAPIILENLASLPSEKYAFAANPEVILEILERTDTGLLLDIPHARVAASFQGIEIHSYLERLPLERVRQVHVSGVREDNGYYRDAHESMLAEDYAILEWVLERCKPLVVTLEYFRGQEPLREQLWKLRELIDS